MATYTSRSRSAGAAKCSVCLDNVKLAEKLPCDHRYCQSCISHQMSRLSSLSDSYNDFSIVCPYCRDFLLSNYASRTNPSYSSTGYTAPRYTTGKSHVTTKCHVTGYGSKGRSVLDGKEKRCEPCAEGRDYVVAASWCHQCSEYLCSSCAKFHRSMKMSKDHFIKTIRDKERYDSIKSKAFDTISKSSEGGSSTGRKTPVHGRTPTPSAEDGYKCEPCGKRKKTKKANFWCDNCSEKLCDECSQCHRSMKMSKTHKLLRMKDLLQSDSNFSAGIQCERHAGEMLSLFCKRCHCSCCGICAITLHSNCGSARKLPTSKAPIDTSKSMDNGLAMYMKNLKIEKPETRTTTGTTFAETENHDKTVKFGLKSAMKATTSKETKYQIPRNRMEVRKTRIDFGNPTEGDWVTSMAVLVNGDILIIELYQTDMKMFDATGNFLSNCSFIGDPWSVAAYNDSLAAVTFSDRNQVQLVNITRAGLQLGRKFSTRHKNLGVCFAKDLIVTSCWEGCIHVMNISGRELFYVHNDVFGEPLFSNPEYIAADRQGQTVYVSDFKRNSITALSLLPSKLDNKPQWVFTDKDMKGPKGITVDRNGVIYVSAMTSRNIFRLSPDGRLIQVYRRREDVDYYEDIAVSSAGDRILVSAYQDPTLIKFKLTK